MTRKPPAPPIAPPAAWRPGRFIPVVVAVATILAFLPALQGEFVSWDDDKNFLENQAWRGLGPDQLRWMWTTFHLGTWIPLSWMSLGLDYVLWGLRPGGFHATNIALHAAAATLLFLLLRRILAHGAGASAHLAREVALASALGALVFAVHPLRVESVAWITERRDVLSGAFYVGTLLAYVRSVQEGSRSAYAIALVCAIFALLAKGTAVTIPVALLILNIWPLRRVGGPAGWVGAGAQRVYASLAPFALLAGIFTVVVFAALQDIEQLPPGGKLAVMAYSLRFYLLKTLVPIGLSPLYAMPAAVDPLAPTYLASAAFVMVLAVAAWVTRRRLPAIGVGLLAFAAILFPLLGVHQGGPQIVADRNTYNASFVVAAVAALLAFTALRRARRATVLAGATTVALLGALTWGQAGIWRDSETLWRRVLAIEPDSPYGHNNLGNVLVRRDALPEARRHFEEAIRLRPGYAEARTNLGVVLAATGDHRRAIREFENAAKLNPRDDRTENNWGVSLAQSGAAGEALAHFTRATQLNPGNAEAHVNWGNALVRLGKLTEAEEHYRDALSIDPTYADAQLNWGVALAQQGRLAEAAMKFEAAAAADPSDARAAEYLRRARLPSGGDTTRPPATRSPRGVPDEQFANAGGHGSPRLAPPGPSNPDVGRRRAQAEHLRGAVLR